VKEMILNKKFTSSKKGKLINKREEVLKNYENFLLNKVKFEKGFRVGIDPGNGCGSGIVKRILEKFGLSVVAINDAADGRFPSRSPEPNEETISALKELVKKEKLDFGVAFDGDCDRAFFVDDKGNPLRGDVILALFVRYFLNEGEKVVYEVSCSSAVEDEIKSKKGIPILSRVGHAFIIDKMINEKAKFGGEISSHLYFGEMYGMDDAIFATLKVVELLSFTGQPLSELINKLPKYETYKENFEVADEHKFKLIEKLQEELKNQGYNVLTIDGAKVITEGGWFILRASNTQPQVRLTVEAKNKSSLQQLTKFATENFFEVYKKLKGNIT
jgi:phosphomannomutase/phosphoglucomutase